MITVLVVDDQPLVRQAIAGIISIEEDLEVVGTATNGQEAVAMVRQIVPDVVVMDIRMPVMDGIEATTRICALEPPLASKILILTTFEEDEYVLSALHNGASGFIGKGVEPEEIIRGIRSVHAGDALLSPVATRSLITRYMSVAPREVQQRSAELAFLTERELEVLELVAKGMSNQEIAEHLYISINTSKTHVNRIMMKTHSHDRAQLVILAYESGLLVAGQ